MTVENEGSLGDKPSMSKNVKGRGAEYLLVVSLDPSSPFSILLYDRKADLYGQN